MTINEGVENKFIPLVVSNGDVLDERRGTLDTWLVVLSMLQHVSPMRGGYLTSD